MIGRAETKYDVDDELPSDFQESASEEEIFAYAHKHMHWWGFSQEEELWITDVEPRIAILEAFGFDLFTRESGEEKWREYLNEMRAWVNEHEFVAFMAGQKQVDEQIGKELRDRIMERVRQHGVWFAIYDALGFITVNEAKALTMVREHMDEIDFEYKFVIDKDPKDTFGPLKHTEDTILTFAIQQGNAEFVGLVLDIAPNAKDLDLNFLCEFAKQHGQWHIYQKLELTRIGRTVFERVEVEKERIEKTHAIVNEFMREYERKEAPKLPGRSGRFFKAVSDRAQGKVHDNKVLLEVTKRVTRAIRDKKPISDELLLIAWRYGCKEVEDPLKSPLWEAMRDTCLEVLQIPLDKVHWKWFQIYLIRSCIWFERIGSGDDSRLLYDELVKVVQLQWEKPREHLRKHITAVQDTDAWRDVIGIEDVNPGGGAPIRQDQAYDTPYEPVRMEMGEKELREMSLSSGKNILGLYDMQGYLSGMVIRAYELDNVFHEAMRRIFRIDMMTGRDDAGLAMYTAGPVKTEQRCQAKAQNDYHDAACPSTASIVDIIRGSLVFKDVAGMVQGFRVLTEAINSGECAIKKVVRVKNTLRKNEKKRLEQNIYRYGDIKLNVLIVRGTKCIIGEVQLMTKFMLDAKKMDHELYEIIRRQEFITNVDRSLNLSESRQQEFVKAAIEGNLGAMSGIFVNYPQEIDIFALDTEGRGYSVIHRVCITGNYKAFNLIVKSFCSLQDRARMVNLKSSAGDTPLTLAAKHCNTSGHFTILKYLLGKYREHVDVNHQNKEGDCALLLAAQSGRILALRELLAAKGVELNLQNENEETPVMAAAYCRQVEAVRMLGPIADINIPIKSGTTPLLSACFDGYDDIVAVLLELDSVNVNYRRPRDGHTALLFCCQNGHPACTRLMLQHPDINPNLANDEGATPLYMAVVGELMDCAEEMARHPDTDVNHQAPPDKQCPLMAAAMTGPRMIRWLLARPGIDPHVTDSRGHNALDYAKMYENDEGAELLVKAMWN